MKTAYDLYKNFHPDYFSDSTEVKVGKLDKDFLDYYLDSVTSRNQHTEFEELCRHLAEKEICPNLIQQTGPTGGGDSKVDTETFPVADEIVSKWYHGIANKSGSERWAFAISAKKDWKPKLKSDLNKINIVNMEQNRGYTKVFFMSNQYISDKKRADEEDNYRQLYHMDVRILDRGWILDRIFKNGHQNIVVNVFHLSSEFLTEKKIGSRDYKKINQLEEIEKEIQNYSNQVKGKLIDLEIESSQLSCQLENPFYEVNNKFLRAYQTAKSVSDIVRLQECIYQWAWACHWWYMEFKDFYSHYLEYEELVTESNNSFYIERLVTLWTLLFKVHIDNEQICDINLHTTRLSSIINKMMENKTMPNSAFDASASNIRFRLFQKESIKDIFDDCFDIIAECDSYLDFNLDSFALLITKTPVFKKMERYEEIFELTTQKLSERKNNILSAQMWLDRAIEIRKEKPYTAIKYLGNILMKLHKDESKSSFCQALYELGQCFEQIECFWAARNYYIQSLVFAFKEYLKFGNVIPSLIFSSKSLSWIELRLGRLSYAIESRNMEKIANHLYGEEISTDDNYDNFLAIAILNAKQELFTYFDNKKTILYNDEQFYFSGIALAYRLGNYEENFMNQFDGKKENCDNFMQNLYNHPSRKQLLYGTWFGFENTATLKTKILGCTIEIDSINNFYCKEISSCLLSMIESFLSTASLTDIIIIKSSLSIRVSFSNSDDFFIKIMDAKSDIYDLTIECSSFTHNEFISSQDILTDFLYDGLIHILAKITSFSLSKDSLEKIISQENAFNRAITFCNTIFRIFDYFGTEYGQFDTNILIEDGIGYKYISTDNQFSEDTSSPQEKKNLSNLETQYISDTMDVFDMERVSQQNIEIKSIINVNYWDNAKWHGVMLGYVELDDGNRLPTLGLVFQNRNYGIKIFEQWATTIGKEDSNDSIYIGIIKGINKDRHYDYRVMISSKPELLMQNTNKVIQLINRLHTMNPTSDINLTNFESVLQGKSEILLFPGYISNDGQVESLFDHTICITPNSIEIKYAWMLKSSDYLIHGLMSDDNPYIPDNEQNDDLQKILAAKKNISNKHNIKKKISRNDPCPCGSGLKYKKCCGK